MMRRRHSSSSACTRLPSSSWDLFSDDGALLAAEAQVRERGESNLFDVVIVWSVVPDGNSGGQAQGPKILCMDTLSKLDELRKDDGRGNSLGDQYLVVGSYQGEAASFVVTR
jgi:hypothetical protein